MPSGKQEPDDLHPHPLIDRLLNRAAKGEQPPNVQALSGYLARDTQPGYWRIYQNLNLNAYCRVAEADIVGSQDLATEQEPLNPSIIWIRLGATLEYTRIESRVGQAASFLQGGIMSGFLRGAIGSRRASREAGLRARAGRFNRPPRAEESVDLCPSVDWCRTPDYGACFTRPANCRSEFGDCPTGFCETDNVCPTDVFCETYQYQLC